MIFASFPTFSRDFPGGSDVKSICLQCGRPGFNPWVGKIPWRRKWQPIPVFLPGKFHGRRSLAGYSPCGRRVRTWLSEFTSPSALSSSNMSYTLPVISSQDLIISFVFLKISIYCRRKYGSFMFWTSLLFQLYLMLSQCLIHTRWREKV